MKNLAKAILQLLIFMAKVAMFLGAGIILGQVLYELIKALPDFGYPMTVWFEMSTKERVFIGLMICDGGLLAYVLLKLLQRGGRK